MRTCTCGAPPDSIHEPICDLMRPLPALEPVEIRQCQAMIPDGYSPVRRAFGASLVRCRHTPDVVARELSPGEDGRHGSMSLCLYCARALETQQPGRAELIPIGKWLDDQAIADEWVRRFQKS